MTDKPRMGRPPKPASEQAVKITITLPPALAKQLRDTPEGPSRWVAARLRER